MARYIAQRLLQAVFVVWAAFTLTFVILFALPGDAVTQKFGASSYIPPEQYAALQAQYGIDQPLIVQYGRQLGSLLRGDLGLSISTGIPVSESIREALPQTVQLATASLALAIVAAVAIALGATITSRATLRQALLALPAIGASTPGFWIGLVLLWALSFRTPIFPGVGDGSPTALVLPAITLAIHTSATLAQVLIRSLDEEWVATSTRTARAEGHRPWSVLVHHSLPNALLPTLTVLGTTLGELIAGTVVVETVFTRNGIGRLVQVAVTNQDVSVVQGVVIVTALVYASVNLVVDLLYPVLDPRIRARGKVLP